MPTQRPEDKADDTARKILVIGDSMVKHINQQKIQRAAGDPSIVQSYSGAKVDQINAKLNEYMAKDQFHAVIVHVGTNDLVHEGPEAVATKMDDLIARMKGKVKRIAVSSVIKRYDGRVTASSITHFNNLVKSLCAQHNVTFINNDHIDKSFLNRSNLHLNKIGDTALGRAFCTYLRSIRNESVSPQNSFFCNVYHHRKREWIRHLQNVKQMMNH